MKSDETQRTRKIALTIGALLLIADFIFASFPASKKHHDVRALTAPVPIIIQAKESVVEKFATDAARAIKPAVETEPAKKTDSLTPVERDLCRIHKLSGVPLDGDLRVQSVERIEGGRYYSLKSSSCPDELYSIVWLDRNGRVEKEVSCQNTSLTELTINSGLQFNIDPATPDPKVRAMALSGPGRFLVNCWDGNLTLTRDGRFNQESAALINAEGCTAWTKKDGGRPVRLANDEKLDERGCSSSRECVEVFEIDERDNDAFNFKTKNSLSVLNERGLKSARATTIFHDSVEDLDSVDRSLTGVENWEHLPPTRVPANCPE